MNTPAPIKKIRRKLKPWKIALIAVAALAIGFGGFVLYKRYIDFSKLPIIFKPKEVKDTLVPSNLDGTKVAADRANRHPLAIIVENHPDARPQSGLNKASIVYEAIAEGGITRFMGVYGPNDADKVGPVRSARTYYIDWLSEFNAFYAHVGGNLDALDKINTDSILDLNQFSLGEAAYWREPQAGKAIEHTMFTSTSKLYDYAFNTKKWAKTQDVQSLKFTTPVDAATRPASQNIEINFSSPAYKVDWKYDPQTNKYLRSMGGTAHKDKITDEQLAGTNIIIQQVDRRSVTTAINESGYAMDTIGTGPAKIFSQGKQIDGTWKKTDRTSRTVFYDSTGAEITFIPGQFWIEITPPDVFGALKIS